MLGRSSANRNVFAFGVSSLMLTIFAVFQVAMFLPPAPFGGRPSEVGLRRSAFGEASSGPPPALSSVALVPLFLPRIAVVVVAVSLPEAWLVVVENLQARDPLRALPE